MGAGMPRRTIRALLIVASLGAMMAILPAAAAADPTFGVMNASGGIYWRSAPDWNTAVAVAGNGFYPDTVIAVQCYQSGAGNVPGSANNMWERATRASGSGSGSGWINEHFINDGVGINQPSPGVPPCTSPPPPPPPPPPPLSAGQFGVMNASGGIYWRSSPDWSTPVAVAGNGFYPDTVIAVSCYQSGAANVPGSSDAMWEKASVARGSGSGSGWINEHFINDGAAINQPSPGVPPCGASPPGAPSPTVGPSQAPPPPPPPPTGPPPTSSEQILPPDPNIWCVIYDLHARYDAMVRETGFLGARAIFTGVKGTAGRNDWRCAYTVVRAAGNGYVYPPRNESWPVDFAAACRTQFPGSRLRWISLPGPVRPILSWPWECVGQAGKYYPPPGLAARDLVEQGGYVAKGVPAPGAGRLSLRLAADVSGSRIVARAVDAAGGRAAVGHPVVVATGTRSVRRSGRYALKVSLTRKGKRLLQHRKRGLKVKFRLLFARPSGGSVMRTTTGTIRARGPVGQVGRATQ